MNADEPTPDSTGLPASHFGGTIGELIHSGMMHAPTRPGLLATLDRFEIVRVLGAGGMGIVFLARDPDTATQVAIKLLRPELIHETRAVHYFLNEAQHMRRLQHPHILPATEVCAAKERPYFVMPFVEAGSLARRIQPGRPLDEEFILAVAIQIAAALQYAHRKGIIHRDIKPSNVLIDSSGHVWLSDFGLARSLLNPSLLDEKDVHLEGTAPYLSPQAARGEVEDTRGDIYAFGGLLYEMLTGEMPYPARTAREVLNQIREGPPRPVLSANPKAPPALARIAEDAMARELRERYASMGDVLADLERVCKGQRPRGSRGRAWSNAARRMARPLGAAVILVGLVLGVWAVWPRHRLVEVRTFSSPAVQDWQQAKIGNWHDAETPALFVAAKDQLLVFSLQGEQIDSYSVRASRIQGLEVDLVADVWAPGTNAQDGRVEVLLSWTQQSTNQHLAVLNQNLSVVRGFQAIGAVSSHRGGEHDVTQLRARLVADLDGDGRREVLALVNTGYDGKPRGLYCFDFDSQSLSATPRWQHLVGPSVLEVALFQLDAKGRQGVLLGTGAVNNNIHADDGSDDLHSYLYAFSDTGDVLWRSQLGDAHSFARPLVTDLEADGQQELLAWITAAGDYLTNEVGRIVQLDRSTGAPLPGRAYDAHARLLSCLSADLNGDHTNEIIATDNRGFVHILDANLKRLSRSNVVPQRKDLDGPFRNLNFVDLELVAITNLDSKPDKEIVLTSYQMQLVKGLNPGQARGEGNVRHAHDLKVHVLNARLEALAVYKVAPLWQSASGWSAAISKSRNNLHPEIFVFAKDKVQVLKFD